MAVERFVVVLTIIGVVDAISYMVVTPSLVFYVLQNGGNKDQYGLIMSVFSFSSFCTKPFLGWWSDKQGFRVPYFTSVLVAFVGGLVYIFASALPHGTPAVGAIFLARLLGGCGAANSALGFAYVARSVPPSKQTSVNSLLSLCRILGMSLGPGVNILVAGVDLPIGNSWKLDSLNSVGIILVIANFISMMVIVNLLEEPTDDGGSSENKSSSHVVATPPQTPSSTKDAVLSFFSMDILIPMLSIYSFNANFQLIETGAAPAANDALGWGPVETSIALGSISIIIAGNMFAVMTLSKRGVSDSTLLCGGLVAAIVAYVSLYFAWIKDSTVWNFYLPVLLGTSSFPYMSATTRSIFTVCVNAKPALREYQGSMQAVLGMAGSVAGFTTPGIVAAYCLRHPEEVLASSDGRELTAFSLFFPTMSLVVLIGVVYLRATGVIEGGGTESETAPDDDETPTESSSLLPQAAKTPQQARRSSNLAIVLEGNFEGVMEEQSIR